MAGCRFWLEIAPGIAPGIAPDIVPDHVPKSDASIREIRASGTFLTEPARHRVAMLAAVSSGQIIEPGH